MILSGGKYSWDLGYVHICVENLRGSRLSSISAEPSGAEPPLHIMRALMLGLLHVIVFSKVGYPCQ